MKRLSKAEYKKLKQIKSEQKQKKALERTGYVEPHFENRRSYSPSFDADMGMMLGIMFAMRMSKSRKPFVQKEVEKSLN